jgi:hypothetical protein
MNDVNGENMIYKVKARVILICYAA